MVNRMQSRRTAAGFTLVELMVTVGIVGILAAIAYPSYQRYVARTHRNAASACLSQYAQEMERYYTANMSYAGAGSTPTLPCRQENNLNLRYQVQLRPNSNVAGNAYLVEAIPTAMQTSLDGLQCGTLTINNTGLRAVSGTASRDQCWR